MLIKYARINVLGSKVKNYFSFDHFFKKIFSMKNQKSTTKMKYSSEKRI